VRVFSGLIILVCLLGASGACGQEGETGGITFSFGFDSFPGKHYYRLEGIKYKKGLQDDYKTNPRTDQMRFSGLSLRLSHMARIGLRNLYAGVEVGMYLAVSGYEKPWDLPALAPGFSGKTQFPQFC
jgi:hypothetical protein